MRKFGEEQGGFRPDRATMDHVFILNGVVRSRKTSGLDSHICFLDIRKAYDTVFREGLWKRLLDIGVKHIWQDVACDSKYLRGG